MPPSHSTRWKAEPSSTNDDELAQATRLMRNFGFHGYDNVIHPGTNGKMIEVCAAMGLSNLEAIGQVMAINQRNHAAYTAALERVPGISVLQYASNECNSHHYVVVEVGEACASSRDEIIDALHARNILARKYFWPGVHSDEAIRDLFPHAASSPNTEEVSDRVIVRPRDMACLSMRYRPSPASWQMPRVDPAAFFRVAHSWQPGRAE